MEDEQVKYTIENIPTGKLLCIRGNGTRYFSHTHKPFMFNTHEQAERFRNEEMIHPNKNKVIEVEQ